MSYEPEGRIFWKNGLPRICKQINIYKHKESTHKQIEGCYCIEDLINIYQI
jgi:hypothetical protein